MDRAYIVVVIRSEMQIFKETICECVLNVAAIELEAEELRNHQ